MSGPARARVGAALAELERATTAQVVVLTLTSLDGEAIEAFSVDLAHNRWKLGRKGKDNGVLITVAVADRRYRIEVGYGLEGVLPDSLVGSIGRERLVPAFRRGDFGAGIEEAAVDIAARIAAEAGVQLPGVPAAGVPPASGGSGRAPAPPSPLMMLLTALVLVALVVLFIKNPGLFIWLLLSSRGGGRGGWGGGGGGGFGGGGGGGFGGGGSSGSW
jgi:uncharacterized protein